MRGGAPGKLKAAARALYEHAPDPGALAALGLTPDDLEQGSVDVWPECWEAYVLFARLRTQWRVGAAGATGLDYHAAYRLIDQLGLSGAGWDDMLDDLQVMEFEALAAMDEAREGGEG